MTLIVRPGFNGMSDPDASAYVASVEALDGQLLEFAVGKAINDFVLGCKNDGIWSSIKASCILAGARTRQGALVPLVGTAPTSFGFVNADYNRKAGLQGDGVAKYLDTGRSNSADSQNNQHLSVFPTTVNTTTVTRVYMGAGNINTGATYFGTTATDAFSRNRSNTADQSLTRGPANSLIGVSRSSGSTYTYRQGGASTAVTRDSQAPDSGNVFIYQSNGRGSYSDACLAFYSIGESIDLARLDTRVTALITAFGAAIP